MTKNRTVKKTVKTNNRDIPDIKRAILNLGPNRILTISIFDEDVIIDAENDEGDDHKLYEGPLFDNGGGGSD